MQAISRLRLLKDLVKADILPAAALHAVEAAALRIVDGSSARWQPIRVNAARYVASCPAIDPPAWLHTDQGHRTTYAAPPLFSNGAESFAAYLELPVKKPSHLTHIVKKCKELAVTSINSGRSPTAADDFFSSISALLDQHKRIHTDIFYCACASTAIQVAETAQAKGAWCWDQASALVQALCNRLTPHWARLNAFSAVNMLQALAKCHLQHGPIQQAQLDAALEQVSACCYDLSQQGVSLAAWSCASLYQRRDPTKYYPLLDQLSDQAMRWPTDAIKLQHTATVIWSMARSQYLPEEELLQKLTEAAYLQTGNDVPHAAKDIEMLFLGYAWLGYAPPTHAMETLVGHFLGQRLQGHQASNMAWALAVLGQLNMPLFLDLLAHVRRPNLEDVKSSRQLHCALEFLRPERDAVGPEVEQWEQLSEQLHATAWPPFVEDKKTRLIHDQVLHVLQEGLLLTCWKDVNITRDYDHSLFSIDILIEEQPGVPCDIAVEVEGLDHSIHNTDNDTRCVGPTMFQNSMLSRHVPCLIRIPYHEWIDKGEHLAHMYLQDKLRLEGHCSLPDFVSPD